MDVYLGFSCETVKMRLRETPDNIKLFKKLRKNAWKSWLLKGWGQNEMMEIVQKIIMIWLLFINVTAFVLYGADKRKAVRGKWRVPEATLIGVAAVGGALGALGGMLVWHHKTRKWKFRILVPLCLAVWIAAILFTVFHDKDGKEEETMTGNIEVFTQSSIRIKGSEGTIYLDTIGMEAEPHDADFIFITHDHYDHYSPEDIAKVISDRTILIVPEKMAETVKKDIKGYADLVPVKPGESKEVNGLKFETVASYNTDKQYHPKNAGFMGYVLQVDGKRIYVAGDMDATEEAKAVRCDIAMVPIGGTFTMDAKEAAGLINIMQPEIAIPTHYGSIVGRKKDADVFAANVSETIRVEKKLQK